MRQQDLGECHHACENAPSSEERFDVRRMSAIYVNMSNTDNLQYTIDCFLVLMVVRCATLGIWRGHSDYEAFWGGYNTELQHERG
jgi:hypothetical protein